MLIYKYRPKKLEEILGNEEAKRKVKAWITSYLSGKRIKPILLYGPVGTGKTSTAYALANEYNLEIIELNASDLRNKRAVDRVVKNALSASSLTGRKKLILIDDIDATVTKDREGIIELVRLIGDANVPIIITANDPWKKQLYALRSYCEMVEYKRVPSSTLKRFLREIAKKEKINISEEEIDRIVAFSKGDVRAALNDLEVKMPAFRDRERTIFEIMAGIFKAKKFMDAKRMLFGDVDLNLVRLYLDENIPREFEKLSEIEKAYEYLAMSYLYESRIIRRNVWAFLKYVADYTAMVGMAKEKPYRKFTRYQFPKYLRTLSRFAEERRKKREAARKIMRKIHERVTCFPLYFPVLEKLARRDPEKFKRTYYLSDEEFALLFT